MDAYPTLRLLLKAGNLGAGAAGVVLGALVFALLQHIPLPLAALFGGAALVGGVVAVRAILELIAMIVDMLMPQ